MSELNPIYDAADAQFLMSLVYRSVEEFDDGETYGHASHSIRIDEMTGVPTLQVEFQFGDGEVLAGEWRLSLSSVSRTGGSESE